MVLVLTLSAILYVILGFDTGSGIMGALVKTTFPGLAVLFPTVIAVLYWEKVHEWACIGSIIIGELVVFLITFEVIPSFGILSGIWGVITAGILIIMISLFLKK